MTTTTDSRACLDHSKHVPWTPEEDAILRANFETLSCRLIGVMLKRTRASVKNRSEVLKLARPGGNRKPVKAYRAPFSVQKPTVQWQEPAPRYPSVWHMAQGVSV